MVPAAIVELPPVLFVFAPPVLVSLFRGIRVLLTGVVVQFRFRPRRRLEFGILITLSFNYRCLSFS